VSALLGPAPATRPTEPVELTQHLYEKYGQRVFTFCYSRLRNREEAQDAAQTTFIYVLRSLQRGVEPEFELAWLLKIAFNVCRGTRRSAGRQSAVTQEVEDMDELAAPHPAGYEESERLAALRDGLAHLPERQRQGILLREWQGLSYAEIADELDLSVSAVETLLFRARRNLASRLQHVRTGFGALNAAMLAPFFRSLARGGLGKLGLIGAGATVVLIPIAATEIAPALGDSKPAVSLRSAAPASAAKVHPWFASAPSDSRFRPAASSPKSQRVAGFGQPERLRQRPVTSGSPDEPGSVPTPAASAPASPAPAAAIPGAPALSPPALEPPAPPANLPVPNLQRPPALPSAVTEPLDALTSALAGVTTTLP
jgi:RNA polymerase sigma-70 factor (ECF subfamily)